MCGTLTSIEVVFLLQTERAMNMIKTPLNGPHRLLGTACLENNDISQPHLTTCDVKTSAELHQHPDAKDKPDPEPSESLSVLVSIILGVIDVVVVLHCSCIYHIHLADFVRITNFQKDITRVNF